MSSTLPVPLILRQRGACASPVARPLRVVRDQRFGLLVVRGQALANDVFGVVRTLDKRLAGDVVLAFDLGRIVVDVVAAARAWVHAAAAHALDDVRVWHVDLEDVISFTPAAFIASACGMVRGKPSNR